MDSDFLRLARRVKEIEAAQTEVAGETDEANVTGPESNTNGYIPLWNGDNAKALGAGIPQSTFATAGHTHAYLPLTGGTLTGEITINATGGKGIWLKDETTGTLWEVHMHGDRIRFFNGSVELYALMGGDSCNRNWYWSGQGGQPPWLWGGSDGTNMYVYNPSNFSVNYANSAGWATGANYAANVRMGQCTLNTSSEVWVGFSSALGQSPMIALTPYTSTSGVIAPKVRSVNNTGFGAIIGGSGFSNIVCDYIAIG